MKLSQQYKVIVQDEDGQQIESWLITNAEDLSFVEDDVEEAIVEHEQEMMGGAA